MVCEVRCYRGAVGVDNKYAAGVILKVIVDDLAVEIGAVHVGDDVIIPAEGEIVNHLVTVVFSEERQRWEVVEIR